MSKFKTGLVEEIKKEKEEGERQEFLHRKYRNRVKDGKEVVIVEKNNMVKFFARMFVGMIRTVCRAVILVLAAIGLAALVYPEIRRQFLLVLVQVFGQLQVMIGR